MLKWVEAENPGIKATLIVGSHVIELERLAFKMGYDVAGPPGALVPREHSALAAKNQSAAFVEGHPADMFARRDERLDPAAGTAPVDAAQHHIGEIEPVVLVDSRAFQQTECGRQKLQFHA